MCHDNRCHGRQELCGALEVHLRLLAALVQQLAAGGRASAPAGGACCTGLLGLATRYRRAVGALFELAAPVSLAGAPQRGRARCIACSCLSHFQILSSATMP